MPKTHRIAYAILAALMSTAAPAQTLPNKEYAGQPSLAQIGVTSDLHVLLAGAGMGIANIDGYPDVSQPDLAGNVSIIQMFGMAAQYGVCG